jgi:hypothetical protein
MQRQTRLLLFNALVAVTIASIFAACGTAPGTPSAGAGTAVITPGIVTPTATVAAATTVAAIPLTVMSVDMSVNPSTIGNLKCGTSVTVTYTAVFHFPANNAGGQVAFNSTTTNGRGTTPAGLTVPPGQTSVTYTFNWSGQLPADNTAPGLGGVMVTSPNAYTSQLVAPSGPCMTVAAVPFKVNSISMTASPALTGHACGSTFTENYTATFHIAAGGPGGTIVFQYTTTNGRSNNGNVALPVSAGKTTATYVFKWSGTLPADHTAPGIGIVMMTAPSTLISPVAIPTGLCS